MRLMNFTRKKVPINDRSPAKCGTKLPVRPRQLVEQTVRNVYFFQGFDWQHANVAKLGNLGSVGEYDPISVLNRFLTALLLC